MAPRFQVGSSVWVPSVEVRKPRPDDPPGTKAEAPYALRSSTVVAVEDRSVIVSDTNGDAVKIATRRVHDDSLGFLVVNIGDFATEESLLPSPGR